MHDWCLVSLIGLAPMLLDMRHDNTGHEACSQQQASAERCQRSLMVIRVCTSQSGGLDDRIDA
jgi:hypothetical protein